LRSSLHETSTAETRGKQEAGSLLGLLRHHRRAFLIVIGYTAGGSLIFYTFTTYMQKYLVNTAGFDKEVASLTMTTVLFVYMLMQPLFGTLSDRIGRRNSMLIWAALSVLTTVPLLTAIGTTNNAYSAFLLVIAALAVVSLYTSISGIVKAEMFPAQVRALGVGFAYAIGNALFGGTAEYVALWFKSVGHEAWFFWYVTAMMAIALMSAILMPDPRRGGYLQGEGTTD
jgi:MHS family alpha-ketoglutarate permease-like MFS transporter